MAHRLIEGEKQAGNEKAVCDIEALLLSIEESYV